eukprot:407231-Heterocapsa_arctica.AAC.1
METTGQRPALRRLGAGTVTGGLLRRHCRPTMTPTTTTATRPHDGRHGHQPARLLPLLPRA